METQKDQVKVTTAASLTAWRNWLATHHDQEKSVWLVIFHKESDTPSVYYEEAVEEALCFGWIDSKPNKRDAKSYYQYFSKRNAKSNWSGKNKRTVERLLAQNRMAAPGLKMIEDAKSSGTWDALVDVENLLVPPDLKTAFDQHEMAFDHWNNFPPSTRRGILEWIFNAKRPETRSKRIKETAEKAAVNVRANQYRS